jgi:hypothetical protein
MQLYQPQLKYSQHVFEPGEHEIDIKIYHDSAGISRSGISELKKSPLHYWQAYLAPNRIKKADTKSMIFGDAVHTKIMEPDLFDQRFAVSQKFDGRTTKGKQAKYEFELANQEKKILDEEQYLILEAIEKEVKKHPLIPNLLKNGKIERSLFWIDSETELLCKARPDIWTPRYLVDIKTTSDSTYNAFCWSVRDYDYHIQAAMIIDAVKELTGILYHNFVFIAVQTTPPYKPYLYNLGDMEIEHGRKEYKKLLRVLRACFDTNKWDSDRDYVTEINLPPYFFNEQVVNNLLEVYECSV